MKVRVTSRLHLIHSDYTFSRNTRSCTETLYSEGLTAPAMRCGLIKSAFRPSDDATTFPFLIPSNAMMEVELRNTVRLLSSLTKEKNESTGECEELRGECLRLADELREAIYRHGVVHHSIYGEVR